MTASFTTGVTLLRMEDGGAVAETFSDRRRLVPTEEPSWATPPSVTSLSRTSKNEIKNAANPCVLCVSGRAATKQHRWNRSEDQNDIQPQTLIADVLQIQVNLLRKRQPTPPRNLPQTS
jgi:hypothetical protein